MAKPTTVEWRGQAYDGISMGFEPLGEQWVKYQLEDGSILRVRIVLDEVVVVASEQTPSGAPLVLAKSVTLLAYEAAEVSNAK